MTTRYLAEFGDPVWDEWTAALYESYAADDLAAGTFDMSLSRYASTAHRLCEELEYVIYENTCPYCHVVQEDIETHQYQCEPMY